jgi:hypothetical protein
LAIDRYGLVWDLDSLPPVGRPSVRVLADQGQLVR